MRSRHTIDLELNIARARLILAPVTMLSVYLDAAAPDLAPWFQLTGGRLEIDHRALGVLLCHLLYAATTHAFVSPRPRSRRLLLATVAFDVFFAMVVTVFTEGPTSPGYAFFAFAIIAVGCREGFRATLGVTIACTLSYLTLIVLSGPPHDYLMRPVYLGMTGYLIGFLGQQRIDFELRVRALEARAQRHSIARSLHDGYVQALAGVTLRLDGCRKLLVKQDVGRVSRELASLQSGIAREYDEVRAYIRSLIELEASTSPGAASADTSFAVRVDFRADGLVAEQILLILTEGVRNTIRHAGARTAVIQAAEDDGCLRIRIGDDGAGFAPEAAPPWSIASRVRELGGSVTITTKSTAGAQLEIALPAA